MASIDARLSALAAAVERRRMEREAPVDDLSRSLYEMGRELSQLDALGKAALLAKLNQGDPLEGTDGLNLDMETFERFIADYGRGED